MFIKALTLTNYRGFAKFSMEYDEHMNLVAGINAAGKSSMLNAIRFVCSHALARLESDKKTGYPIGQEDIRHNSDFALMKAVLSDEESDIHITLAATRKGRERSFESDYREINNWARQYRQKRNDKEYPAYPLVAFYNAYRAILDIPAREKLHDADEPLGGYDGALTGQGNFRQFFAWFRDQQAYEREQRDELKNLQYTDPELDAVRYALQCILPDISNIRVRSKPQAMVATKNGMELEISQFSDGEKCYFAMVGDIACRMARLCVGRSMTTEQILQTRGIVLIDELDLHLHPNWQRQAIKSLPQIFPNIQFIITSHSPQMIGEVRPEQVFLLHQGCDTVRHPANTLGLTSGEILISNMDSTDRDGQSKAIAKKVRDAINQGNVEDAERELDSFKTLARNWAHLPLYAELAVEIEFMKLD